MPRRLPGRAIQAGTITVTQLETSVATTVQTGGGPKITNVEVTSNSYVVLDDTAVDIAGGYIKITGTGFAAGCQVLINNTPATSTTYIGPTEVRAQLPATAAGTYMLYLINADGGVAIRVNGVTFSATPSWVTASDLTSYALGDAISIQLAATGASTFALAAGSTLPAGLTLSAGGLLSGSVTGLENDTSYSFTITATDAENQDSPRTFSITITVQLQVSRSLRFNSADSAHVLRTFGATGNLQTFSVSCWFKRSALGASNPIFVAGTDVADYMFITFTSGDIISVTTGETGTTNLNLINSTAVFRDTAAWYHLVVAFDFANATSTDRIRVFVNGVRQTMTGTYASSSFTGTRHNRAGILHYIGRWPNGSSFFNGYITEFYFIDGLALDPTSFAETNNSTGQYIPKKYTGTYGTNGFYLPFTDNSSVANLGRNYQPLTADPFWNRTVLLLNGTGTNNANNNTFIDSSTNAFAITRNGNTTQGRFSPFTQGGWSNYFNGSNAYLQVASNAAFTLGSSEDFTVECWIYPTANFVASGAPNYIVTSHSSYDNGYTNRWGLAGISTSVIGWYDSLGGFGTQTTSLSLLNKWTHVAAVRSNSTIKIYIDGIQNGTPQTTNQAYTTNSLVNIGFASGGNYFSGYISNVRVVKGTAVYTSNFTPPTALLTAITNTSLLTCHANRFLDSSTNNFAITRNGDARVVALSPFTPTTAYSAATNGGSAYFDGTGDYLTVSDNANLEPLGGNFTIEAWFYLNAVTTGTQICGKSWWTPFYIEGTNLVTYLSSNGSTWDIASNQVIITSVATFRWYHVAMVRNGTSIKAYVNGTETLSLTSSAALHDGSDALTIGARGTTYLNGYIADIRFVKGTAVYTANFTPPTAPVTAIANTQLLLNFTNAGIVDATGDNNIETVGDAKISTAQSKWAGSSMLFDGTGDYLKIPSGTFKFGTANFTVEAWLYPTTAMAGEGDIVGFNFNSDLSSFAAFRLIVANSQLKYVISTSGTSWAHTVTTGSIPVNTWTHLAFVRNGSIFTPYFNGVAGTTATNSSTLYEGTAGSLVGAVLVNPVSSFYNGYINDLRVTIGAARYTGTFTPPTAQFAYNQGDINYNQWVPTNFSVTAGAGNDSLLDVPTNWGVDTGLGGEVRGNYATLNPLDISNCTIRNGNLDITTTSGSWGACRATIGVSTGKWYWEVTATNLVTTNEGVRAGIGIATGSANVATNNVAGLYTGTWAIYNQGASLGSNGGSFITYGASWQTGDIIGIALDCDAGTLVFYKNGVSLGTAVSGLTSGPYFPIMSLVVSGAAMTANFGQRPFAYAAPSGFKSLNTHNLPALAVTKSNTAFDALVWSGDGVNNRKLTINFSPDLFWVKARNSAAYHSVNDSVRGTNAILQTNTTSSEQVNSNGYVTTFASDGVNVTNGSDINASGTNYVGWAWDAGTTTVVNTAGTLQSSVRVNTAAGISIQTWTAVSGTPSIGHGLNAVPKFIIIKRRSSAQDWYVYHSALANNNDYLLLSSTAAKATYSALWGTGHTTTTFSFSASAGDHVSYCFAEVPGFSAFGSYTGNGSTDGPFIYTGFRPRWVMWKTTGVAESWMIIDTARDTVNVMLTNLCANLPNAESIVGSDRSQVDYLSNGFKMRNAGGQYNSLNNQSGLTYIYAAFAESPFKYARAR